VAAALQRQPHLAPIVTDKLSLHVADPHGVLLAALHALGYDPYCAVI